MIFIVNMQQREAQQFAFMLFTMAIFGLLLRNVWATLFLLWAIFLYAFYKFNLGSVYIYNIFFGCVLYYMTKLFFKREHIDFYIKMLFWFIVVNVVYMSVQVSGWDFIYAQMNNSAVGGMQTNLTPMGFLGNPAMTAGFIAMCIPLLATRRKCLWLAPILFIPIMAAKGSTNAIAGAIGFLFILFYRMPKIKKVYKTVFFIISIMVAVSFVVFFVTKVDGKIGTERFDMWKMALHDCIKHPIIGSGLDSFRNVTPEKDFIYVMGADSQGQHNIWDNPHCLYISLFYEFGIVGLLILLGYLRQIGLRFKHAIKEPNTLGLAGFLLVFLIISGGYFPIFLARQACIILPIFALLEKQMEEEK